MSSSGDGAAAFAIPSWGHYYDFDLSWSHHAMNVVQHLPLVLAVRRLRPRSVLEVGTGTGSLSIFMSYFNQRVVSVDLSPRVLERARGNSKRLRGRADFREGDAFALDGIANGAFDVSVSQGFFEHFCDEDIASLLKEQLRVSRYAVFSVPNEAYGRQDRGDERLLRREQWDTTLMAHGLHIVRSGEYRPLSRSALLPGGWRKPATMYLATVTR
ncbi:MAG: class I SAM-dependent methyltransferase [Chloroflexi bacterium]|nr:class I SAM-dependent methyltransferase [Chloroflexota bacterium]